MKRIYSIDFTRGLVMIVMALDHTRDMLHVHAIDQNPTDLTTTTPALFFTRWITHLCAPVFVFLAGSSAYISFQNKGNIPESRRFLLTRGLWLIFLELTVVNFGLFFDLGFHNFILEVIAAIGFGFIVLSLLLKASIKRIAIIGLLIIFCHNLFPLLPFAKDSNIKMILSPLFRLAVFPITPHINLTIAYPPIPWLAIMLCGFASGKLFGLPAEKRRNLFVRIGLGAILLFVILRLANFYGDSFPWTAQKNGLYSFLSFLNITKYPPSLLFCLLELGIMFLILAWGEQLKNRFTNIVSVYGKVPLFYFLIHFYFIHLLMLLLLYLQGFHWAAFDFSSGNFGRPKGVESGVALWAIYLIWLAVLIILYQPCRWFGKYKSDHKKWWLKYI